MEAAEPSWEELREREPALGALEEAARAIRDHGGTFFCANNAWFDITRRMRELLGVWRRRDADDVLGRAEAYEAAFRALYPLLPPCRDCGCQLFDPHRREDLAAREAGRTQAERR